MNGGFSVQGNVSPLANAGSPPAILVMEFLVGMALCRKGPSTTSEVWRETSPLFDGRLAQASALEALRSIEGRGWAKSSDCAFAITEAGAEVMELFFCGMVRLLDAGRGLLDVSVLTSIVREFERKV